MMWQNHSFIRLAIPFTLGMVGANLFFCHIPLTLLFVLCCVVLALAFFCVWTVNSTHNGLFGGLAMTLVFLVGTTLYTSQYQRISQGFPSDSTFCQGTLAELPQEKERSWALNLRQENGTHVLLYVGKDWESPQRDSVLFASLKLGDTVLAHTMHLEPTEQSEGEFGAYRQYLFHQGVCATAYTPHGRWMVRPRQGARGLRARFRHGQEQLHQIYTDHGISDEAGSVIEAMTIGRKVSLPKETRTAYARAGVSHMLALSGFHVSVLVLVLQFFFLRAFLPLRWQWTCHLLLIATLWTYTLLTGASPSLVRAALMFTILLVCQMCMRESLTIHTCALAFCTMLCVRPFYLHDVGFQLSFLSVAAISLCGQRLATPPFSRHWFVRWLWGPLAISLVCALSTAPLVAHHFGYVAVLSLLSNLLLLPLVYLLMLGSIGWWLFLWCPPVLSVLTPLLHWTATTMNNLTHRTANLPFATIEWQPSTLTTLLAYIPLMVLILFITHKKQSTP